ncbi:hypothetical protein M758_12G091200 [Ceratodon purpureus]|nr:hypothetical protein M758_12G091200 [Ceratodon purpureus]
MIGSRISGNPLLGYGNDEAQGRLFEQELKLMITRLSNHCSLSFLCTLEHGLFARD